MSNLSLVTTSEGPDTNSEGVLEGVDYPLIEPGIYEAILVSWETSSRFSKKIPGVTTRLRGGKIYLNFQIDPYNNAGSTGQKHIVFMALNARTVKKPIGQNGKFTAGRRSKYGKLVKRLFGSEKATRATPKLFEKKLFHVKVRTVMTDENQKKLSKSERYSIVDEVVDFA